jgi:signal peptidase I
MELTQAVAGPAARKGFWLAIIVASFFLVSAFFVPVVGILYAVAFFVVAWSIRRGQPWAAVAGACFLLVPFVLAVVRSATAGGLGSSGHLLDVLLSAGIVFVCVFFLLQAAWGLRHPPLAAGPPRLRAWPWIAVIIGSVCSWLWLLPMVIPTGAMEDTLLVRDHVLVETVSLHLGRSPQRGDLVVFRYPVDPKQTFVKRIAGIPGDRLRIQNKQLYRNGAPVQEPYVRHKTEFVDSFRDNFPSPPNFRFAERAEEMLKEDVRGGELVVPEGRYFVLGDNRDSSLDSRYWGFISRSDMIGRPILIYASYDVGEAAPRADTQESALNTRWSRLLKRP